MSTTGGLFEQAGFLEVDRKAPRTTVQLGSAPKGKAKRSNKRRLVVLRASTKAARRRRADNNRNALEEHRRDTADLDPPPE